MEGTTESITTGTTESAAAPATVSPVERPTMAQAFAADAAPQIEATAQPEAATTQPAETTTADANNPSAKQGEPPQEKWPQILDNARAKTRSEVEAEYAWAKNLDRAAVEEAARIGQLYQTDRHGYIKQILAEALSDNELAPLVRSEAARVLGSRQPQPQAAVPDIPIVDEKGQVVGNLRDIVNQHLEAFAAKELAPIKQDYATRQQQEKARAEQAQLETTVKTIYDSASAELPQFKEHEAEIAKVLADIPGDPGTALYRAWAKVVLPKLEASHQAKALEDLKTKANASTVNPAAAVVNATKRPRSMTDPSLTW